MSLSVVIHLNPLPGLRLASWRSEPAKLLVLEGDVHVVVASIARTSPRVAVPGSVLRRRSMASRTVGEHRMETLAGPVIDPLAHESRFAATQVGAPARKPIAVAVRPPPALCLVDEVEGEGGMRTPAPNAMSEATNAGVRERTTRQARRPRRPRPRRARQPGAGPASAPPGV